MDRCENIDEVYNEINSNEENKIVENGLSTNIDFEEKSSRDYSILNLKRKRNGKIINNLNDHINNKKSKYYVLDYPKFCTREQLLEKIKNIKFGKNRLKERKLYNLIIVEKENKYIAFGKYEIKFHYSNESFDIGKNRCNVESDEFGYTEIIDEIIEQETVAFPDNFKNGINILKSRKMLYYDTIKDLIISNSNLSNNYLKNKKDSIQSY